MNRQISITKGTNTTLTFTATNPQTGAIINITGYTAYLTVKKNPRDPQNLALISKNWTSHSDPTNGMTTISLSQSETSRQPGRYYWNFSVKSGANVLTSVQTGEFIIENEITS